MPTPIRATIPSGHHSTGRRRLSDIVTATIALATVVAVLTRPRGIGEGVWALLGGVLLVATGRLSLVDTLDTLRELAGVLAFLVGLFWLTLAANRAGLFDRAARLTVQAARGDGRRLLAAVFVFGTLTTAVLSNDATVVLVTPVVLRFCRALHLPPLPYLFACTFVADTASSLLPISNPINLLYAERLDVTFGRHAALLVVPTLLAVAINAAIFHMLFRRDLPRHFDAGALFATAPPPLQPIDRLIILGLGCVAIGYVVAALVRVAPYWVTLGGGLALGVCGLAGRRITARDLLRVQPPSLYGFVIGLAVVVAAADKAGLLGALGHGVDRAADAGSPFDVLGVTFGTALGTNLVNNWTMALAILPSLEHAASGEHLIFGSMLGADMGPNLSVVGSLATLIWLTEVRRGGLAVSGRAYLRLGILATVPALLAGALALSAIERII